MASNPFNARQDLINQLGQGSPRNTGVSGYGFEEGLEAPPLQADLVGSSYLGDVEGVDDRNEFQPQSAKATQSGQKYALSGYDAAKLADLTHNTEKYQLGRVLEQFDPSLGLQQEGLLDALNKLDIGDFYAESGDRLGVRNARNGARWTDGVGDIIQNYTGEGPKSWTYLDTSAPGAVSAESPDLASLLAARELGGGGGTAAQFGADDFFRRLMAAVQQQAGPASTDRQALIELLGV